MSGTVTGVRRRHHERCGRRRPACVRHSHQGAHRSRWDARRHDRPPSGRTCPTHRGPLPHRLRMPSAKGWRLRQGETRRRCQRRSSQRARTCFQAVQQFGLNRLGGLADRVPSPHYARTPLTTEKPNDSFVIDKACATCHTRKNHRVESWSVVRGVQAHHLQSNTARQIAAPLRGVVMVGLSTCGQARTSARPNARHCGQKSKFMAPRPTRLWAPTRLQRASHAQRCVSSPNGGQGPDRTPMFFIHIGQTVFAIPTPNAM
jgi:hypothetical protein